MSVSLIPNGLGVARSLVMMSLLAGAAVFSGCEVDSFFNPAQTGYWERYPTSIPILDRIDSIEPEGQPFARATPVMPEDLVPGELSYYLFPGDLVTVSIYELYQERIWSVTTRVIDPSGSYRVPEIGDVRAAGLTAQQFEDEVIRLLDEQVITNPLVNVVVEQASGLRYTVYGFLQQSNVFTLRMPDLRLLDALALAGGVPLTTKRIYVIRTVPLVEEVESSLAPSRVPTRAPATGETTQPRVEDLIDQLDRDRSQPPGTTTRPSEGSAPPMSDGASPGMLQDAPPMEPPTQPDAQEPMIDIDDLEPARTREQPPVDIEEVRPPGRPGTDETFIFVPETGEWVRSAGAPTPPAGPSGETPGAMVAQRIIEVNYERLSNGDMSQNIVIRPGDAIYVAGPPQGNWYIDGEIARPGVYSLPGSGDLTLSRAITAAGGFGAIAIPWRVDLTRKIGQYREATVRLDVAAIRNKTEPDVVIKADDHIIVGTNWFATPLAVIRNGFRATYGFGFLLDRNFGNDVFGSPPVNQFGN